MTLKDLYPDLFGTSTNTSTNYGILANTGISATNTVTINNSVYGSTSGISATFNGSGALNNGGVSAAQTSLNQFANLIMSLPISTNPPIPIVTYPGSTTEYVFEQEKYYTNSTTIRPGGTLTFNANGLPNASFYIVSETNIFFSDVTFNLINGAQAGNIFWQAQNGITFNFTGGTTTVIDGVFISQTGNITLRNTVPYTVNGNILAQVGNVSIEGSAATINPPTVCYLKGTFILTENGYVAIEDIKVGDKVVTKGKIHNCEYINVQEKTSLEPVVWIGGFKSPNLNNESLPICIKANALEENQPFEDLYVSPGHRILLNGKMVLPKDLINGTTIYQDWTRTSVEYYHLELESHYAIVANGILSESYLDGGNLRVIFENNNQSLVVPNTQPILA